MVSWLSETPTIQDKSLIELLGRNMGAKNCKIIHNKKGMKNKKIIKLKDFSLFSIIEFFHRFIYNYKSNDAYYRSYKEESKC